MKVGKDRAGSHRCRKVRASMRKASGKPLVAADMTLDRWGTLYVNRRFGKELAKKLGESGRARVIWFKGRLVIEPNPLGFIVTRRGNEMRLPGSGLMRDSGLGATFFKIEHFDGERWFLFPL